MSETLCFNNLSEAPGSHTSLIHSYGDSLWWWCVVMVVPVAPPVRKNSPATNSPQDILLYSVMAATDLRGLQAPGGGPSPKENIIITRLNGQLTRPGSRGLYCVAGIKGQGTRRMIYLSQHSPVFNEALAPIKWQIANAAHIKVGIIFGMIQRKKR